MAQTASGRSGDRRPGELWLQDVTPERADRWLHFETPREALTAHSPGEVGELLARVESATRDGLWAAGFISYEAAPAFDCALRVHPPGRLPLAWFGVYPPPREVDAIEAGFSPTDGEGLTFSEWRPTIDDEAYAAAVESIRRRIAAGDTYQVNFTLRLRAAFEGDPRPFFLDLQRAQRARHAAWLDLDEHLIASASPELLFRLQGDRLVTRPMKGTAARGRWGAEDRAQAAWLAGSEKNRAENLMIVDMVRNDLGRVAEPGSVRTTSLYDLERYPSIFQLTSTVEARTRASPVEILTALYPCASITGAPKVRTMELIRELESTPRGIYTGSIGYLAPGRRAQFNVAIRTVHFDRSRRVAEYGTGGGIVWDSKPEDESREWRTKALIVARPTPRFRLLETLRWSPEEGFVLLDRHLDRLAASAGYFDFPYERDEVAERLNRATGSFLDAPRKVRLLLDENGELELESLPLPRTEGTLRLAVARESVHSSDRFLFHKTTVRATYVRASMAWPQHDDVLLWNERGELTESTIANLVLDFSGRRLTPALDSGLLAGTLRAEMLECGEIEEATLRIEDLDRADAVWLINSVRGLRAASVDPATLPDPEA